MILWIYKISKDFMNFKDSLRERREKSERGREERER